MTERRTIAALPTLEAQSKIIEIEEVFSAFKATVTGLLEAQVGSNAYRESRQKILVLSNQLRKLSDDLVIISTDIAQTNQLHLYWTIVLMASFILAMVLLAAYVLNRSVATPLRRLSATLMDVETSGNFSSPIDVTDDDEVGQAMKALNNLLGSLQSALNDTNNTMQAVARGDFSARITGDFRGHLDLLKTNINNQIAVLGDHIERIDSISRFREIVQESVSVEEFGQKLVSKLAAVVPAEFGAMYLSDGQTGGLRVIGTFCAGIADTDQARAHNDGLIAQCAKENRTIFFPEIPADYIKIRSGLGEAPPRSVVAIPVDYQRKVLAVIELASFRIFSSEQINFLEELRPIIGLGLENVLRFGQTEALLLETQHTSEKLRERQDAANALSHILRSGLEPLSLQEHVHQVLELLFGIPWLSLLKRGSLFLVDEGTNELVMFVQKDLPDSAVKQCARLPSGRCLCGKAAAEKQVVFASSHADHRHDIECKAEYPHGHYCLPILSGDRLLGVLNLYVPEGYKSEPVIEEFLQSVTSALASIIERKSMDTELLAAKDAAEAANRSKGDFLANMSHEIRTPMNAIVGLSHLALQTRLNDKQEGYLAKIQASAFSLLGIINDILDFSKIEAGKLDIESIAFNLDEVLSNVADMVTRKAGEKGLELILSHPVKVPNALIGDPLRLGQILTNLASNAVKFTEQGEILIECQLLREEGAGSKSASSSATRASV